MKNYYYLVSDGITVRVLTEKPHSVTFKRDESYFESDRPDFRRVVGRTLSIHAAYSRKGVIGIYDMSDPEQMKELFIGVRDHAARHMGDFMETKLADFFGTEAQQEVRDYRACQSNSDQAKFPWSPQGKLLWDLICAKNLTVDRATLPF